MTERNMVSTAPVCGHCDRQMASTGEPWLYWSGWVTLPATEYRLEMRAPRDMFLCPDCEFLANGSDDGSTIRLESGSPAEVYGLIIGDVDA